MSTNIFTPSLPVFQNPYQISAQGFTPPIPNMQPMNTPNEAQMKVVGELAQMFQSGQNPLEELKMLREKVAGLEKQLSEKSTQEIGSLEKQLLNTPKGAAYLDIRKDGIMEILTRHALRNPDTAVETKAFLEGWNSKATEYLKSLTPETNDKV